MWFWFTIPVGVGIIATLIAAARHGGREGIYVGIVESGLLTETGRGVQVRAYVDHVLVHELLMPSKLTSRMIIRETNTSVPLKFVRVPPSVSPQLERSDDWQQWADTTSVLPVIFRFKPVPGQPVHIGQLVDVYIGAAVDRSPDEKRY
jgi:HlyD family secretion protein